MAKFSDAGISTSGNWIKPEVLADDERKFNITNATYKSARGEYPAQVDFTIEFIDIDEDATNAGEETEAMFSLNLNPVRQKFLDWFSDHTDEPLTGIEFERGLILIRGKNSGKGNPPYLFADAPLDDDLDF